MYKIMIVDDEKPVIDSISLMISKNLPNFTIVSTAQSGRTAIEKAKTSRPEIIMIDVNMPGVNGLDAIKEIEAFDPDIIFIIITAYERFDVARTAFDLGVHDYILKPFNQKKVIESLRSAERRIKDRNLGLESGLDMIEKVRAVLPRIEQNFIDSLLLGRFDRNLWNLFRELSTVRKAETACITVLGFRNQTETRSRQIIERVKYKYACIAGIDHENRTVFLFPGPPDTGEGPDRQYWEDILESSGIRKTEADIFIGREEPLQTIFLSYYDALGKNAPETAEGGISSRTSGDLIDAVNNSREQAVRDLHGSLFSRSFGPKQEREIRAVLTEVFALLSHETGLQTEAVSRITRCTTKEDLYRISLSVLLDMVKKIEQHIKKELPDVLIQAEEYIETRFNEPIQLTDVADALGISAPYLSQLFSRYINTRFIDYLTDIRIEKAKELLAQPHAAVKEVSAQVGYQDPNYFSRLYKKHTGMTPTEFIEKTCLRVGFSGQN